MAVLLATVPAWADVGVTLPRPAAPEYETLVLHEEPRLAALAIGEALAVTEAPLLLPLPPEGPPVQDAPVQDAPVRLSAVAVDAPRRQPTLAVVGVGLQGLVLRSEPGGGERVRVADEGTDLRDLGEEREAGGRSWKRVAHPDGGDGWVAADFLVAWDGVDRTARTVALLARSAGVESAAPVDRSWLQAPPEVRSITPDQLKDGLTLSTWEAFAACAPAGAVAFARATGIDVNLDQATVAARKVGWNADEGMPGPKAQLALLASLGIPAHQRGESEDTIDWERVVGDVQAGLPVMIVSVRHYYVAEGYDPETGELDLGNSALVLAGARGKRWFAPDEIASIGYGTPFTTIHLGPAPPPPDDARAAPISP